MTTLADRMKLALSNAHISQSDLARRIGISPASVNNWVTGATKSLKAETASKAAASLNVSTQWLISGVGEMTGNQQQDPRNRDYVALRKFDVAASCGPGAFEDPASQIEELVVSREWFAENISPVRTSGYDLITARGDSMEPTFANGDMLVIDTLDKDMKARDGCYVFFYDGFLYAKRVQITPNGFLIISDNSLYKSFEIPFTTTLVLAVFGRIVKSLNKRDFR